MSSFDRPDSLTRAFHDLVVRLREAGSSTQVGLIERALALIKAGFSFDESIVDGAFEGVEDSGPKRVSLDRVENLVEALQCAPEETLELKAAVFPTYIFGQHISKLRKEKGWTRRKLIRELDDLIPKGVIEGEKTSEGWLQQIDEGRKAKILWPAVVLLAKVLECNYLDEFKLLLEAGYDPLTGLGGEISEEVDPLAFAAFLIRKHPRGGELLKKVIIADPKKFFEMTAEEVLLVFEKCLALLDMNDRDDKDRNRK